MPPEKGGTAAFTLVELLSTLTLIGCLLALAFPSLSGLATSIGHRSATHLLLQTFEQARTVALENHTQAYVGFADDTFQTQGLRRRAFVVFRDRTEDDIPAAGTPGAGAYVPLTSWVPLPRGIQMRQEHPSLLGDVFLTLSDTSLPRLKPGDRLPVLAFDPTGAIQASHSPDHLRLSLGTSSGRSSHKPIESIAFSRFTGRARIGSTTQP